VHAAARGFRLRGVCRRRPLPAAGRETLLDTPHRPAPIRRVLASSSRQRQCGLDVRDSDTRASRMACKPDVQYTDTALVRARRHRAHAARSHPGQLTKGGAAWRRGLTWSSGPLAARWNNCTDHTILLAALLHGAARESNWRKRDTGARRSENSTCRSTDTEAPAWAAQRCIVVRTGEQAARARLPQLRIVGEAAACWRRLESADHGAAGVALAHLTIGVADLDRLELPQLRQRVPMLLPGGIELYPQVGD